MSIKALGILVEEKGRFWNIEWSCKGKKGTVQVWAPSATKACFRLEDAIEGIKCHAVDPWDKERETSIYDVSHRLGLE